MSDRISVHITSTYEHYENLDFSVWQTSLIPFYEIHICFQGAALLHIVTLVFP